MQKEHTYHMCILWQFGTSETHLLLEPFEGDAPDYQYLHSCVLRENPSIAESGEVDSLHVVSAFYVRDPDFDLSTLKWAV